MAKRKRAKKAKGQFGQKTAPEELVSGSLPEGQFRYMVAGASSGNNVYFVLVDTRTGASWQWWPQVGSWRLIGNGPAHP